MKLLDNGKSGAIFRSEDSGDLAHTVLNLLENAQMRKDIAVAGYEKAKSFAVQAREELEIGVYDCTGSEDVWIM